MNSMLEDSDLDSVCAQAGDSSSGTGTPESSRPGSPLATLGSDDSWPANIALGPSQIVPDLGPEIQHPKSTISSQFYLIRETSQLDRAV